MITTTLRGLMCALLLAVFSPASQGAVEDEPCQSGAAFQALSLPEAVAVAMSEHPQVLIAQMELRKANAQALAAVAPFLPSASVSMQGERFVSENPNARTTSVGSTVVGGQQSQYSSYASLNANWNLYNGGRDLAGYRGAQAGVQASENDLLRQTNDTLSAVLTAYNDLFKVQAAYSHQAEIAGLQRGVLQRSEKRYAQGIDNQLDLSRQKLAMEKSKQAIFQVCQALVDKSSALAKSLGVRLAAGQVFRLASPIPDAKQPEVSDDALEVIVQADPGVKAAKERVTVAQQKLQQSRGGFYPTVAMTGRYDWLGQDPSSAGAAINSTSANSYRFGLVLQQPLGPFTAESAAVESAYADLLKADALYRQALIDAETKFRTALNAKKQTELSAKSGQLQAEQARLSFRQTSQLFKDGYADHDAVSQAQISLSKEQEAAEQLQADAKLAGWNAYLALHPDQFASELAVAGTGLAGQALTDLGNRPELPAEQSGKQLR